MRISTRLALIAFLGGCAHQLAPLKATGPRFVERSVFPLIVSDQSPAVIVLKNRDPARPRWIEFSQCAAVYVAPHLIATTTSAFPRFRATGREIQPIEILIVDGDHFIQATDVALADKASGLVILHTDAPGQAVELRTDPLPPGTKLDLVGYAYGSDRLWDLFPTPRWDLAEGSVAAADWMDEDMRAAWFKTEMEVRPRACGTAAFDEKGRLAGFLHEGLGRDGFFISAGKIRAALRSLVP